jgi:hypothetical protein
MLLLERDGDTIVLHASPTMATLVGRVPNGRHDSKRQVWVFPLTWQTCIVARGVLGAALTLGPALIDWARGEKVRVADIMAARAEAMGETLYDGDLLVQGNKEDA